MKWIDSVIYRLARYLIKHNIIKVMTEYEVIYYDVPIANISVDDKLCYHYDNLCCAVDIYKELPMDVPSWKFAFRSKESCANFLSRKILFCGKFSD